MNYAPQNLHALKSSNRARVLECIRRYPLSRIEIARRTGLTKSAVTMLTNEMIREGLLYEKGNYGESITPGRPSIPLDIVAGHAYAVGVMLHRKSVRACIVDLKMNRLAQREQAMNTFESPEMIITWVVSATNELLKEFGITWSQCVGIGISSPGPVDRAKGIILNPPHLQILHNCPIVSLLKKYIDCPIHLENNSASLAQADFYRRGGSQKNTLFIVIADGIGSALLQEGSVYYGAQGYAGELGHMSVDARGERCACGNRGCLEQYVTLDALKKRFGFLDYKAVVNSAASGNKKSIEIIDDLTERLGMALVNSVNLYDVESIVVFGEYSYRAELLTKRIEEYIRIHSLVCQTHSIVVLPSELSLEDADIAASVPALNSFFQQRER